MTAIVKTANEMFASKPVFARMLPFTVFVLIMASEPILLWFNVETNWHYCIRSAIALLLLLIFRREYSELFVSPDRNSLLLSFLVGCFVFLVWIIPYPDFLGSLSNNQFEKNITGSSLGFFLFFRFFGSGIVVPFIEELFWRSFLTRRLDQVHFEYLDPRNISIFALLASSTLFAFEHQLWFAGLIAGLAYGLLYKHFENLWLPIAAHITTNTLLGVWVIHFHHWEYW